MWSLRCLALWRVRSVFNRAWSVTGRTEYLNPWYRRPLALIKNVIARDLAKHWQLSPAASLINTCRPPLIGLDLLPVISNHLFHIKFCAFQFWVCARVRVFYHCSDRKYFTFTKESYVQLIKNETNANVKAIYTLWKQIYALYSG